MAFALVMTITQCKKNEETTTSNDEVVSITLDVNKNNGSKVNVNPATGTVDFESGDKIYVGSGGKYIGFLTHNGTNFSGNITNPTENQPLQFYFLGNVIPQETLSAGTTEECSVIIRDQTEHLPVISCAASNENYVSGVTAYSAHLLNKCALVKFNVTTPSNSAICITGMNNKVMVNFGDNTLSFTQDGNGGIILPAGDGEHWSILLPQSAVEAGDAGSAYSVDGAYTGNYDMIPAIHENDYLTAGIEVTVTTEGGIPGGVPEGAINGLFTINESGDQVCFSKGNLQYQASTNTWRFAENQWNCIGADNSNISSNYDGWIDLFGWGTSGYHNIYDNFNVNYQPYSTSSSIVNTDCNTFGYGPSTNMYDQDLTGMSAEYDWGVHNAIGNGGNQAEMWRTLSAAEWQYLMDTRATSTIGETSNARFVKAIVNGITGIILFPDVFSLPIYLPTPLRINNRYSPFNLNNYSGAGWDALEELGCVFLPVTGYRNGMSYDSSDCGYYWTTSYVTAAYACYLAFNDIYNNYSGYYGAISISHANRFWGCSVRLVCNAE